MRDTEHVSPRSFPAWLAWLFPLTYVAHIAEEFCAGDGFPAWANRAIGVNLTPDRFLTLNAFGLLLMLVGIGLVLRRRRRMDWILTAMATAFLLNAVFHAVATIGTSSYSPGLVSAIALWCPLGVWTLARAWRKTSGKSFARAVAAGVVVHLVVVLAPLL